MTKKDLIQFLEPFEDDTPVVVGGAKLMLPLNYELQYRAASPGQRSRVVIYVKGTAVIETGIGAQNTNNTI